MKRRGWAVMLTALVGTVVALVPVTPAGAATDQAASCDEGHWPATVQGIPSTFHAGAAGGYYIWHDDGGWHLRTTTPVHRAHSFSGSIVSSDNIVVARQVRDEGSDSIAVNGHRLSFSFQTYNGVDGVDFRVGCTESVTFLLKAQGRYLPASRIWLGEQGHSPSNPFTIYRIG
jgi:hypothetical protein